MGNPMALSNLTLSDLERSNSRSLRFWVIADMYSIQYICLRLITTIIWMSPKRIRCRRGFPLSQRSFLFLCEFVVKPKEADEEPQSWWTTTKSCFIMFIRLAFTFSDIPLTGEPMNGENDKKTGSVKKMLVCLQYPDCHYLNNCIFDHSLIFFWENYKPPFPWLY